MASLVHFITNFHDFMYVMLLDSTILILLRILLYSAVLLQSPLLLSIVIRNFSTLELTVILLCTLPSSDMEELRKQEEEAQKQKSSVDPDFPNKRRNMIIAGLVALSAMVTYAYLTGLIQFEIIKDPEIPITTQPPNFALFDNIMNEENQEEEEGRREQKK